MSIDTCMPVRPVMAMSMAQPVARSPQVAQVAPYNPAQGPVSPYRPTNVHSAPYRANQVSQQGQKLAHFSKNSSKLSQRKHEKSNKNSKKKHCRSKSDCADPEKRKDFWNTEHLQAWRHLSEPSESSSESESSNDSSNSLSSIQDLTQTLRNRLILNRKIIRFKIRATRRGLVKSRKAVKDEKTEVEELEISEELQSVESEKCYFNTRKDAGFYPKLTQTGSKLGRSEGHTEVRGDMIDQKKGQTEVKGGDMAVQTKVIHKQQSKVEAKGKSTRKNNRCNKYNGKGKISTQNLEKRGQPLKNYNRRGGGIFNKKHQQFAQYDRNRNWMLKEGGYVKEYVANQSFAKKSDTRRRPQEMNEEKGAYSSNSEEQDKTVIVNSKEKQSQKSVKPEIRNKSETRNIGLTKKQTQQEKIKYNRRDKQGKGKKISSKIDKKKCKGHEDDVIKEAESKENMAHFYTETRQDSVWINLTSRHGHTGYHRYSSQGNRYSGYQGHRSYKGEEDSYQRNRSGYHGNDWYHRRRYHGNRRPSGRQRIDMLARRMVLHKAMLTYIRNNGWYRYHVPHRGTRCGRLTNSMNTVLGRIPDSDDDTDDNESLYDCPQREYTMYHGSDYVHL